MKYIGLGMTLGLCFGAALGGALTVLTGSTGALAQNVAVGVAFGVALGGPCGMLFNPSSAASTRKNVAFDRPPSRPLDL